MATEVDNAIAESILADLNQRAQEKGFRALLNGDELVGNTTGGFKFRSDTDTEGVIYDTSTGEPRIIPATYMAKTLQKRRGRQKAFIPADPETGRPIGDVPEYKLGNYMCFLHPDHPDREALAEIGIGAEIICGDNETEPAAHIRDAFNLRMHEMHKHPQSYAIREEAMKRQREDEQREEQRQHTAAILRLAEGREGGAKKGA